MCFNHYATIEIQVYIYIDPYTHTHKKKNRVRVLLYIFFVCVCDVAQVLFLCCRIVCQTSLFGVGNKKKAEANWMKWKAEHISLLLLIFFYRPMKKRVWIEFNLSFGIIEQQDTDRRSKGIERKKKKKLVNRQQTGQQQKIKTGFPFFSSSNFFFSCCSNDGRRWRLQLPYRYQDIKSKRRVEHFILLLFFFFFTTSAFTSDDD